MPCNDVTENLVISLNADSSIASYALRKRTCGAKVGNQSFLQEWVRKQDPSTFLTMEMDTFLDSYDTESLSEYDRFIALKHFETLKNALGILVGQQGGTKNNDITLDLVEYIDGGLQASMFVGINIDPSDNPGCGSGGCGGGCGSKK